MMCSINQFQNITQYLFSYPGQLQNCVKPYSCRVLCIYNSSSLPTTAGCFRGAVVAGFFWLQCYMQYCILCIFVLVMTASCISCSDIQHHGVSWIAQLFFCCVGIPTHFHGNLKSWRNKAQKLLLYYSMCSLCL